MKFTTVWEQKHVEAERTGDSTSNFISWIAEIEGVVENNDGSNSNDSSAPLIIKYLIYLLSLLALI